MKAPKVWQRLGLHWKPLALYGGLFALLAGLLIWQLNTLTPGYSANEAATYQAAKQGIKSILETPFNLPFTLLVKALSHIFPDTLLVTRLAAVMVGFATLVLFALILHRWHDRRTTIIGTLLFGTSAWFLHTARFGAPEAMLFGVFALVVCGYWLKRTGSNQALVAGFALAAGLLYTPGMIWFIVLGVVWQWKVIDRIFRQHLVTVMASGLAFLAALIPLGWFLYKNHSSIKPWLGLPAEWPNPIEFARNIIEVPFHLFIRNQADPETWLGTAQILDIFSLSMFALGTYLYLRYGKLVRTQLFIAIAIVMTLLIGIGSHSATFTIIIPFVYLIVAAGAAYLIEQWFKVFPRNPIARAIGVTVMSIAVGLACMYQFTHYFIGWPVAQATHDTYSVIAPLSGTIDK